MKISACMIAKNEEKNLPRCLNSIKGIVDEIVIVDTGSTDNTVKIAKTYGAKVYHHPWQDSFSLHRNQAFEYATGDWFFIIDCDEQLVRKNLYKNVLKKRLAQLPENHNALVVTLLEYDGKIETSWLGIRFFNAAGNPKYKHSVHNTVSFEGYAAGSDIQMIHYGYSLPPEQMKEKTERTRRMLLKDLANNPDDYRALYYMCQLASGQKNHEEVIKYGVHCLEYLPIEDGRTMGMYSPLYLWLGFAYLLTGDGNKSYACATKGLEFFPNDIDLNFLMAQIGYLSKRDDLFFKHSKAYLKLYKNWSHLGLNKTTEFENHISASEIVNRATYLRNPNAKSQMQKWINTFHESEGS